MIDHEKNTKSEHEESYEAVVNHNFEMLKGEMEKLLMEESIGGNAGTVTMDSKSYSCGAANGYADPESGKITIFGNFGEREMKEMGVRGEEFTLRVACNFEPTKTAPWFFKIVDFYGAEQFSATGRDAIERAIERYNKEK